MLKRALCWVVMTPFLGVLAIGLVIVAICLFVIYRIADIAYELGAEWSA